MTSPLLQVATFSLMTLWVGTLSAAPAVEFPGPVKEAVASDSGTRVFYVDPGENKDGNHLFSLRIRYPDGRTETVGTFMRSVAVDWSPSGKSFSVYDRIGSNIADCLVITPGPKTGKMSMTEVLARAHIPAISEKLRANHVYVACSGWESEVRLHVHMWGDLFMVKDNSTVTFARDFTYDLKTGALSPKAAAH